ncbi:MAG: TIGR02996 domain-containing protein [Isosphaeraceae bacterium]
MTMRNEADFLAALQDDPDDDGLRLVFADWLEERGDPRFEYVRVMVETARRERDGHDTTRLVRWLVARGDAIDGNWREAVGIRYEVVLESVERSNLPRVVLTLAVLTSVAYRDARALAARPPVVVARLVREEAERVVKFLEAGRFTARTFPRPPRPAVEPVRLCQASVHLPGVQTPSREPPTLPYHLG